MSSNETPSILGALGDGLTDFVAPLLEAATSDASAAELLEELGWQASNVAGLARALRGALGDLATGVSKITELVTAQEDPDVGLQASNLTNLVSLLEASALLGDSISKLASVAATVAAPPAGLDQLAGDVVLLLTDRYLEAHHLVLRGTAEALTLYTPAVRAAEQPPQGGPAGTVRQGWRPPALHLERLGPLLRNPMGTLRAAYTTSGSLTTDDAVDSLAQGLLPAVADALSGLGLSARYGADPFYFADGLDEQTKMLLSRSLNISFGGVEPDIDAGSAIGASFVLLGPAIADGHVGAAIAPNLPDNLAFQTGAWTLQISVTSRGAPFGVSGWTVIPDTASSWTGLDVAATVQRRTASADAKSSVAIGLEAVVAQDTLKASLHADIRARPTLNVADLSDGFLHTVLPAREVTIPLEIGVDVSRDGLKVSGGIGSGSEIAYPLGSAIRVGPVSITRRELRVGPRADGLTAAAVVTLLVSVGPFTAAISSFGVEADVKWPAHGGNAGPLDIVLAPRPPSGIGLAIDSPAVRGGGFLELDYDAGRYAGVFELTIVDIVSVKAIAIITTKNADGTPGFALLIMITADGFKPIPLGFGFELTGIGGLLALNRTVNAEAVRGGLRDGVVDSVLFVQHPVQNATRILSTLDRIFPLAADRLLIGPLVEIGWGTPPIVKIRLALLLEIPKPVRAILLAALSALLPDEQHAVVELHVDAIGVLDLGRGELSLDASLHDSRILQSTLSGDMALRLNWGAAPVFICSVGGFHPKFVAPAGLRPLNRLSLSLGSGQPSVRLECYLAITSNSVQFGARLTLSASIAGFGVDGGGAFDALIQWSPFALDISLQAWVRITAGGATLLGAQIAAEVSGPQPWHVTGVAQVSVLFFSASVHIDFTSGTSAVQPPVDTVDVTSLIWAEIGKPAAWQAALAGGVTSGVTLSAPGDADTTVVVHPFATLSLRQKVAPLDTPISKVGGRLPSAGTRSYHVDVSVPGGVLITSLDELFAPAEFQDFSDDAKLTSPSFEPLPAGVTLSPEASTSVAQNGVVATDLTFETLDVTSLDSPATSAGLAPARAASAHAVTHQASDAMRSRAGWQVIHQ